MIWTAIALAAAVCEACGAYDVAKTEQGLKKGVAAEAFTFLVGTKPSAIALYLRDQTTARRVCRPRHHSRTHAQYAARVRSLRWTARVWA